MQFKFVSRTNLEFDKFDCALLLLSECMPFLYLQTLLRIWLGNAKATGENLKLVWVEFSTVSCFDDMSMWMHDHIYSWKLSPGLVQWAEVCPRFDKLHCTLLLVIKCIQLKVFPFQGEKNQRKKVLTDVPFSPSFWSNPQIGWKRKKLTTEATSDSLFMSLICSLVSNVCW